MCLVCGISGHGSAPFERSGPLGDRASGSTRRTPIGKPEGTCVDPGGLGRGGRGGAMTRDPAARASAARDNVNFVDVYRPGALEEIRSGIPAESLDVIDSIPGFSWLPFEHDHWLMDRTLAVLGREDAVACWRRSIGNLIERPLLKNFVDGSLRLFGARPGKILKMLPKGWSLAYRDFCTPTFALRDEKRAEIRFEQVAPQAFESEGYLHCWHGICLGVFDLEKPKDGIVSFEIDRGRSLAVARFSWA